MLADAVAIIGTMVVWSTFLFGLELTIAFRISCLGKLSPIFKDSQ